MQSSERKNRSGPPDTSGLSGVLRTAGAPLDRSVLGALESRFGHDFSSVRVHSDPVAADIHARAWTHADHIAFAPGAYAPHTRNGLRLLAHELTHVVLQRGGQESSAGNAAEAEANAAASAVARGDRAAVRQRGAAVQYQFEPGYDPWPEKTEAARIRAEMPLFLAWRGTHPAGFPLSKEEKDTAEEKTGTKAPAKAASAAGLEPKFVLHDTDSSMTVKEHFKPKAGKEGPQGAGWVAGVPHPKLEPKKDPELDPVVTRDFFEPKRPTTTGFEKGEDIIGERTRERFSQEIWKASAPSVHGPAVDAALADTGLSTQDADEIKKATTTFLDKGGTPKVDGVKTTVAWTSVEICKRVSAEGADNIADSDPKKHKAAMATLDAKCKDKDFAKWIESRKRIGERVNVEIAQIGEGKALPDPPYGPTQYEGVANLYLKAALAALRWPSITTHRWEDRDIPGGHDDPRCFDLDNLYDVIATKMSHPAGTIYGLVPKYGGAGDADANISWTAGQCHGKSPSQKAAEAKAKDEKKSGTAK
jgi:hypothetical protein